MRVACLAWGSLVWDPRGLALAPPWYEDGPNVPVEFARQSGGHRLTLVLGHSFQVVPSLWAWMDVGDLDDAVESLREREGTVARKIGVWKTGHEAPELIPGLPAWAADKGAASVIWTALPPKFQD